MKKIILVLMVMFLLLACTEADSPNENQAINNDFIQNTEEKNDISDESNEDNVVNDDVQNDNIVNTNDTEENADSVQSKENPITVTVIATADYVVGGILDEQWASAKALVDLVDVANYGVYSLSGKLSSVTGDAITESFEPGEGIYIPFDKGEKFEDVLYISDSQNTYYREVKELSVRNDIYLNIIKGILIEKNIESEPAIKRIIKFDMEGDGVDEVLLAAANTNLSKGIAGEKNEYSFVILRKIINNEVKTYYLAEAFYTEDPDMENGKFSLAYEYNILGILDLNGDGILEIILRGNYYEGEWCEVFEFMDNSPYNVLSNGIGL